VAPRRDAGALDGLARSGRRGKDRDKTEIERLRKRAERAEAEFERTRAALDLVGKAHALLETLSESADTARRSKK
jgi:transposase